MNILILASNLQQASFIRRGIRCENLDGEIQPVGSDGSALIKGLTGNDGVFIVTDEAATAAAAVENCVRAGLSPPIIILTGRNDPFYSGLLSQGRICAVFVRPFPFRQIVSEMRQAVFRKREIVGIPKYVLRDLELDILNHQVCIGEKNIYLRNKEFSLLHYMMVNKGRVLTRSDILQNVWDRNTNILTNTVDVHVSQLRKKIDGISGGRFIRTVPCLGYMLE